MFRLCLRHFKYTGRRVATNGNGGSNSTPAKASTLPPRVAPPLFSSRPLTAYESETGTIYYFTVMINIK